MIEAFHWLRGNKKPALSPKEKENLRNEIKKCVTQLDCLASKIEFYRMFSDKMFYNKIADYQFALKTQQDTLNDLMEQEFDQEKISEVEELSEDIEHLVAEVDENIASIDSIYNIYTEFTLNLEWVYTGKLPQCYLPRYSASCMEPSNALSPPFMKQFYLMPR